MVDVGELVRFTPRQAFPVVARFRSISNGSRTRSAFAASVPTKAGIGR